MREDNDMKTRVTKAWMASCALQSEIWFENEDMLEMVQDDQANGLAVIEAAFGDDPSVGVALLGLAVIVSRWTRLDVNS